MKWLLRLVIIAIVTIIPLRGDASDIDITIHEASSRFLPIQLWWVEESDLPLINIAISFRYAGSAHDPADKQGLAYMAAKLFDSGVEGYDELALKQELERHAISLSAHVSNDYFTLSIRCLQDQYATVLSLLQRMLHQHQLDDVVVERVRNQTIDRLRKSIEKPSYQAARHFDEILFGDHVYAQPALGTVATLEAITSDDIRHFYRSRFDQDAMQVAVVGDVNRDTVNRLLGILTALPKQDLSDQVLPVVAAPPAGQIKRYHADVPQSVILFGHEGIYYDDPDFYAFYLLNHIVGGGLSSLLMKEVRIERGLAYGIGTNLDIDAYSALWTGQVATRNQKVDETIDVIKTTLAQISEAGISEAQLREAKQYVVNSYMLQLDKNARVAGTLNFLQQSGLGKDYLQKRSSAMHAVTLEQINSVAKEHIRPADLLFVVVGGD